MDIALLNKKIVIETGADFTPAGKRRVKVVRHTHSGKPVAAYIRWYVGRNAYRNMELTADNMKLSEEWFRAGKDKKMENRIAKFFKLPETIQDGEWHEIGINGTVFQYRSFRNGYCETLYRKNSGFGQSNPAFSVSSDTNVAARIGFYLLKDRTDVEKWQAIKYANSAIVVC